MNIARRRAAGNRHSFQTKIGTSTPQESYDEQADAIDRDSLGHLDSFSFDVPETEQDFLGTVDRLARETFHEAPFSSACVADIIVRAAAVSALRAS